tara:strand:- start:1351 stop:1920 length:570 start_codon:yes stop_codon:yes gene_type:complete
MRKFAGALLGTIFVMLITSSIQYASADHSLGGNGIFKDENTVNLVSSNDSKYIIHLQIVIRNAEGQLISVTEMTHGKYVPHKITDQIFHNSLDGGQLVKIDKIVYHKGLDKSTWTSGSPTENAQKFYFPYSIHDIQSFWGLQYCIDAKDKDHGDAKGISCIPIFTTITPHVSIEEDDIFTLDWTILKRV